jgi:hypothetical protein
LFFSFDRTDGGLSAPLSVLDHDPVVDLGDAGADQTAAYRCILPWLSPMDARRVLDGQSAIR